MKDKNYKNTRGAGDGDLTAGLLGMMQGGGAMEYPAMMKAQKGGEASMTNAQMDSIMNAPLKGKGMSTVYPGPPSKNAISKKAVKRIKKAFKGVGRAKKQNGGDIMNTKLNDRGRSAVYAGPPSKNATPKARRKAVKRIKKAVKGIGRAK